MRILIPILGFAQQGGYRVLSELANSWIRMGHDCTFLVPATSGSPYFPTNASILRYDRHGHFTETASGGRRCGYDNVMSLWAGLRKIGKDYDVILANHCLTAWPVRWANSGKAKKFYYIQAYEPDHYPFKKHPVKHLMSRMSYALDLKQISNSPAYIGYGIRPLDIIPPGIDPRKFFSKVNPGRFSSGKEIVLGTIGRIEPYKGTSTALAAYRLLKNEYSNLRMNVGIGNVAAADDIKITPIKDDEKLASYYRSVDILVVSCIGQHGAPHYPLIEAMASGTPVVHTGYYPGTAANSWEAADTSVEAVAHAIRQVVTAPSEEREAKANAARQAVVAELGWDAVGQKFLDLFHD
ncbi:MAG: glycosyltransferase family 4 protein [Rhodobacteraceae bacterium]|nr:glycosyltransferase family 4 protein [Paracoccaceae bacterium]